MIRKKIVAVLVALLSALGFVLTGGSGTAQAITSPTSVWLANSSLSPESLLVCGQVGHYAVTHCEWTRPGVWVQEKLVLQDGVFGEWEPNVMAVGVGYCVLYRYESSIYSNLSYGPKSDWRGACGISYQNGGTWVNLYPLPTSYPYVTINVIIDRA